MLMKICDFIALALNCTLAPRPNLDRALSLGGMTARINIQRALLYHDQEFVYITVELRMGHIPCNVMGIDRAYGYTLRTKMSDPQYKANGLLPRSNNGVHYLRWPHAA